MIANPSSPYGGTSAAPEPDIGGEPAQAISEALGDLVRTARSRGRDPKLVVAMLHCMASFLLEHGVEATITAPSRRDDTSDRREEATDADYRARFRGTISAALRSRLTAVIDSLSDDETARILGISNRQVRRRALGGGLYFFQVGRKRRYPCWQFIGEFRVLPSLRDVTPALPRDWPPEAVQAFMTTENPQLLLRGVASSPVEWLIHGGEPLKVSHLLGAEAAN